MKTPLLLAMAAFGLLFLADTPEAVAQQSGRARVLVVPLQTGTGVRSNFGEKIADEVRKNIGDFPTMASIEEKEVKAELKRLKLNEKELGAVQWRQLAGRMNAQVVMYGTIARNGSGNAVNVAFIDAKTGDELAVPEFVTAGDGSSDVKESATTILTAFERHVEYQQALLFCQDYLQADQFEDALRNCEKALQMNPGSLSALLLRGSIYVGMEDWEKARNLWESDRDAKNDIIRNERDAYLRQDPNAIEEYCSEPCTCDVYASLNRQPGFELTAPMATIQLDAGRKQKMRPGDLLGALTGDAGLPGSSVGKIDVFDLCTFVAVERPALRQALNYLAKGKVKGRKVKARKIS